MRGNLRGPQGATGSTGSTGSQGIQGPAGTTGSTGAPGAVWRSGAGAPAGALGIVGDWYLNTTDGGVYEKTGSSTYTLRDNLTGPQGVRGIAGTQGPQGNTGSTGNTGSQGVPGTPGSVWRSGAGAPAGALGVVGDWYLNTTDGGVYEKTGASAWTLRDNLTGPQGATGTAGTAGAAGSKWFTQAGAPATGTGAVGDFALDSTNGDYYEKTGASTWTLRGNLKGPQGATGTTGSQGPQGNPGTPGLSTTVYRQTSAPGSPRAGDVWVDTDAPVPVIASVMTYAQLSKMGAP